MRRRKLPNSVPTVLRHLLTAAAHRAPQSPPPRLLRMRPFPHRIGTRSRTQPRHAWQPPRPKSASPRNRPCHLPHQRLCRRATPWRRRRRFLRPSKQNRQRRLPRNRVSRQGALSRVPHRPLAPVRLRRRRRRWLRQRKHRHRRGKRSYPRLLLSRKTAPDRCGFSQPLHRRALARRPSPPRPSNRPRRRRPIRRRLLHRHPPEQLRPRAKQRPPPRLPHLRPRRRKAGRIMADRPIRPRQSPRHRT
jgi:hypothetical protein